MYGFRVIGDLRNLESGVKYEFIKEGEYSKLKTRIKSLEVVIECQKETIERQGKACEKKHNILCSVKEVIDEYFEGT